MEQTQPVTKKTAGWGYGVWALYGGFVVFILACVGFAAFQRFDLVEDNYYSRGLQYQERIDRTDRAGALDSLPTVSYRRDAGEVMVTFPVDIDAGAVTGTVTLFRPSNASWDRTVPLVLDSTGLQVVSVRHLLRGPWRVKLDWAVGGRTYYLEELLIVE